MVISCSAYGCSVRYSSKIPGLKFHRFPKDPLLQKKWCLAVRRKDFQPTRHSRICSQHFDNGCFSNTFGLKTLSKDAVPTIYDPSSFKKTKKIKITSPPSTSEPDSLIDAEDSITQPHTNSPLVIKLHPRNSTVTSSSNEEEIEPNEDFVLPTELNSDFLTTLPPSKIKKTSERDINLTVYVNKIYCCSSKSNPSNSKGKGCSSVLSRNTENNTNSLNNNLTEQSAISTITNALLPENETPSLQTVSYEPVAISSELLDDSNSSQITDSAVNDLLRGRKVKVSMNVNKYIFSNTSNEIAGSDLNDAEKNMDHENLNDPQTASNCEKYAIEDFTMSDMEDSEKSKIYFHLANTKLMCLEEEIVKLRKLK